MTATKCTGCGTRRADYVPGVSHMSCGGTFEPVCPICEKVIGDEWNRCLCLDDEVSE